MLGLFGVQRPDDSAVQQRRQKRSADQQTASQFAGADGRESAINDAGVAEARPKRSRTQALLADSLIAVILGACALVSVLFLLSWFTSATPASLTAPSLPSEPAN